MGGYTPQTEITDRVTRIQGRINPVGAVNTSTRIADGATAINAGMAVIKSTADNAVILPAAAFTYANFQGVVGFSPVDTEATISAGSREYDSGDVLTIAKSAEVEILLGGTVTKDADLFFVHTAGGASLIHTFRADADTARASAVPMIANEGGVAGQVIKAQVSEDARISQLLT